jgi:hypothetical protein
MSRYQSTRISFRTTAVRIFSLALDPTMTIGAIKQTFQRDHDIPSASTQLVLGARFLDDSAQIQTINIPANSYIIIYTAAECDGPGAPASVRGPAPPPEPAPRPKAEQGPDAQEGR